jgi:hypothetical protein
MLGIASHLTTAGHRVRFLAGDRFADAVRGTGAEFVRWPDGAQIDHRDAIAEARTGGDRREGMKGLALNVERIFVTPALDQYRALRAAIDAEPTDAVLTEFTVVGAAALARRRNLDHRSWRSASSRSGCRASTRPPSAWASCPATTRSVAPATAC